MLVFYILLVMHIATFFALKKQCEDVIFVYIPFSSSLDWDCRQWAILNVDSQNMQLMHGQYTLYQEM